MVLRLLLKWIDTRVVDGAVNGARHVTVVVLRTCSDLFDKNVVDGAVNGVALRATTGGSTLLRAADGRRAALRARRWRSGVVLLAVVYLAFEVARERCRDRGHQMLDTSLSIITYLPLVGALLILFFVNKESSGGDQGDRDRRRRDDFLLSLLLWFHLRPRRGRAGFQFIERCRWIPSIGVELLLRGRRHRDAADPADHAARRSSRSTARSRRSTSGRRSTTSSCSCSRPA